MYLLLCCIIIIIILVIVYFKNNNIESFNDYQKCRNSGHTKQFCVINPLLPNTCICENGQLGRKLPGFKGTCVCQDNQIDKITNYVNDFTDDLLDQQFGNLPGDFNSSFDEKRAYDSQLDNFFYKRNLLKNAENIIPYKNIGNFSFY